MKYFKPIRYTAYCVALTLAASCSDEPFFGSSSDARPGTVELQLQAEIDQINVTRADDNGFADGDRIGIFAVNYLDGKPGELLDEGNQATNVGFIYDESTNTWTGERQLYFKDDETPMDVYGYYPYSRDLSGVRDYSYSVERNQGEESADGEISNYEKSDFLWGKTNAVTPVAPLATVTFRHLFAGVRVTLLEGNGFSDGEWEKLEKSVLVSSTTRESTVDLMVGSVVPYGDYDGRDIYAAGHGNEFRAIVIPQTVAANAPLLKISAGTDTWQFARNEEMNYLSGRLHSFTIQVNKKKDGSGLEFSLVSEAVTPWESDHESHNGEAKEYVIINVPQPGGLPLAIRKTGYSVSEIENMKVIGPVNQYDLKYIRESMPFLRALNMREMVINEVLMKPGYIYRNNAIPDEAFKDMRHLRTIVLPENLKAVGDYAFGNTSLGGTLNLPASLEYIGIGAFGRYYGEEAMKTLTGTLRLPSGLKYIGPYAFSELTFSGELIIPESVEYIGYEAFSGCDMITGELHIPEKTTEIGGNAFARMRGLTGKLVYPHGMKSVCKLAQNSGFSSVVLPEGPEIIEEEALSNLSIRGDLIIPATVREIRNGAFENTSLSHIVLPPNIDIIPERLFKSCSFLTDTITIPSKVEIISEEAFAYCFNLNAVIIPKSVHTMRRWVFSGCSSLTYLRCDATEPPQVDETTFHGINKDNFTLEVPENSVDLYRNAPGWKEFRRISAYRNFVARPSKYNVLNNGGTKEIILNADADWELTDIPSWCHIDKTSGSMKTVIRLTVDKMAHGADNRTGRVTFRLKGSSEHYTHINVGQYDYEYDEDEVITLQKASQGRGVNIFLVGDGFDAIDISEGRMLSEMRQEVENFFGVEPFATYRNRFNVYLGVALSEDSGVEDVNHWRQTKFHTVISNSDTRLETDYKAAISYAASASELSGASNLGVILVANSPVYEGVTYSAGDNFCAVVTLSDLPYPNDARGLIQHEAGGHGIGWLADEYRYHSEFLQKCTCICCRHLDSFKADQANGFGLNLSLTGKFREVPWHHLMTNPDYDDIVDVYEGGYFHGRGVFRSEYNSCMNNNVAYFSTWSRQLIVQRIMSLSGETFTLSGFLSQDKRNVGEILLHSTRAGETVAPALHGRPPVFIKKSVFDKMLRSTKNKGRRR